MVETGHEPYTYESFRLTEDLLFVCLDYSIDGVEAIIAEIMRILGTEGSLVHIAVFHHNCLGEGWETFDWTTRLLSEVILKSPADSAVEYNDFCDKENWPGIGKYMTSDNSGD